MYCTQCGAKIEDDSLFCTSCGTKTARNDRVPGETVASSSDAADAVNGKPSTESPSSLKGAVESAQKHSCRRMPLVVLVALALALTSAIAFAAYYAYTEVIAPQQSAESRQSTTPPEENTEENQTADDGRIRYRLYYEKCQEYLDQYGEPQFEEQPHGSSYATGFVFAKLIGSNDNDAEELVLGRRTPGEHSDDNTWGGDIGSTTIEAWRFDPKSNSLKCVLSEIPSTFTNGGFTYFHFVETSGFTFFEEQRLNANAKPVAEVVTTFKSLSGNSSENGESLEVRYDQSTTKQDAKVIPHYYLNGTECDVSSTSYCLGPVEAFDDSNGDNYSYRNNYVRPQDTISTVANTMSQLQHLAEQ